jgi:hypothetical protein
MEQVGLLFAVAVSLHVSAWMFDGDPDWHFNGARRVLANVFALGAIAAYGVLVVILLRV